MGTVKEKYIDVTDEWLNRATPNSHRVKDAKYFKDRNGIKYFVDGKNVVLDYSLKEKEVAEWLENTFGGKIYMLPKVNKPDGIRTPDYMFRNEYWDLKEIKTNGKNVIDNRINAGKKQTKNFILDITGNSLSDSEILFQIKKVYNSLKRNWVEKIIVIRDYNLIVIYKKD